MMKAQAFKHLCPIRPETVQWEVCHLHEAKPSLTVIWSSTFYLLRQVSSNTQSGRGWEFNSDLEKYSSCLTEEPLLVSKWVTIKPPTVEKYSGGRSQQVHLAQLRTAMRGRRPRKGGLGWIPCQLCCRTQIKDAVLINQAGGVMSDPVDTWPERPPLKLWNCDVSLKFPLDKMSPFHSILMAEFALFMIIVSKT